MAPGLVSWASVTGISGTTKLATPGLSRMGESSRGVTYGLFYASAAADALGVAAVFPLMRRS